MGYAAGYSYVWVLGGGHAFYSRLCRVEDSGFTIAALGLIHSPALQIPDNYCGVP